MRGRRAKLKGEAWFSLNDDFDYEVGGVDFSPGERPSYDSPGDGPEVDLAPFVKVWQDKDTYSVLPIEVFILYYASACRVPLETAEWNIKDKLIQNIIEDWEPPCDENLDD